MDEAKYDLFFENEDRHWWFTARRDILLALLDRCAPLQGKRLLDVGCGTGMLAAHFARAGARVTALDASAKALDCVRSRDARIRRMEGTFPEVEGRFPEPFDVVCLLDVLEHIDDDARGLAVARGLLAPGGTLLATAPAFPSLWSAHDVANHHRRRYRRGEFRRRIEAGGFDVLFLSYFNSFLFPLVWIVRKLRRDATGLEDHAVPPGWVNGPLRAAFVAERPFLRRGVPLPVGLSLVCVARRRETP